MGNKTIQVPITPGESIYYITNKFGIVKYEVEAVIIKRNGVFIEISGNFDLDEVIVFSVEDIGTEIFLSEDDAKQFTRESKCQTQN